MIGAAPEATALDRATSPTPRLERLGDRSNPILVRVVRQELRNRTFVAVFLLLLSGATIAALVVAGITHAGDNGEVARVFFAVLALGWSLALGVIQPIGCFRAIANERNDDTWDLVALTGMRPLRVVGGLLLASLVQGLLYTSALAPFMVMAYLLRGIDLMAVIFLLIIVPLAGVAASCLAVFAACLSAHKAVRAALGGLLGLSLIIWWFASFGLWFNLSELTWFLGALRGYDPETLLVTVLTLNGWLAGIILLLTLSGALLAHRAENRSTGPRVVWWLIWLNGACWPFLPLPFISGFNLDDAALGMIIFTFPGIYAAVLLGLFATTEDEELSPRQARSITGAPRWRRPLTLILGPGAARGHLGWLAMAALSLLIGLLGWGLHGFNDHVDGFPATNFMLASWAMIGWAAIIFTVSRFLYRGVLANWFPSPPLRRGFTLLVLAIWMLLPLLFAAFGLDVTQALSFLSPSTTVMLFEDGFGDPVPFAIFSLVAGLAIVAQLVLGLRLRIVTQRVLAKDDDRNPRGA